MNWMLHIINDRLSTPFLPSISHPIRSQLLHINIAIHSIRGIPLHRKQPRLFSTKSRDTFPLRTAQLQPLYSPHLLHLNRNKQKRLFTRQPKHPIFIVHHQIAISLLLHRQKSDRCIFPLTGASCQPILLKNNLVPVSVVLVELGTPCPHNYSFLQSSALSTSFQSLSLFELATPF